ncbi:MAG: hypothetical protein Kapaf2KO_12430 [Candidatus Kapaibacteriales bacterium]
MRLRNLKKYYVQILFFSLFIVATIIYDYQVNNKYLNEWYTEYYLKSIKGELTRQVISSSGSSKIWIKQANDPEFRLNIPNPKIINYEVVTIEELNTFSIGDSIIKKSYNDTVKIVKKHTSKIYIIVPRFNREKLNNS